MFRLMTSSTWSARNQSEQGRERWPRLVGQLAGRNKVETMDLLARIDEPSGYKITDWLMTAGYFLAALPQSAAKFHRKRDSQG